MNQPTDRIFTTQDVLNAFPWMSPATLHYRIKQGFLPLRDRSRVRGIPNKFTEQELIQAGVLDCLASFGVLQNVSERGRSGRQRSSHSVYAHALAGDLSLTIRPGQQGLQPDTPVDIGSAWDMSVIAPIYRKHNYDITIRVETEYRRYPPERLYSICYYPSTLHGRNMGQDALSEYQSLYAYGSHLSIGFVLVKRIFEEADFGLAHTLTSE